MHTFESVCAGIDREYDEKVKYWPTLFGKENVPEAPVGHIRASVDYS